MSDEPLFLPAGTLTRGDLLRFNFFHSLRRIWLFYAGLVLILGLATMGWIMGGEGMESIAAILAPILAVLLLLIPLIYFQVWQQYSKVAYLREPMRYSFSRGGVGLVGPSFKGDNDWRLVQSIYETKTAFILYQQSRAALILPKRFFWGDEEQIERWRKFVLARLVKPAKFHPPGMIAKWF